ncbi:hypothetical protein [Erythrobacter sp. WG]|uniref:hypothetical protein n=1 Tax=Erythrobacter sp. WG TaxID=2985510 RepID=UPI00226E9DA0|nr:hypothetical protein [Erythrobacter sp. WG]MCX9148558.1 hypothetical protein [Erythrobacter sp. WG]
MCPDRALVALHAVAVVLALAAATVWPRAGQAAILVPVAGDDLRGVIGWTQREGIAVLELDTARDRIVARFPDNRSLLRALSAGLVPIGARAATCQPRRTP